MDGQLFQLLGGVCDGTKLMGMENLEAISMPLINTRGYDAIYERATHGQRVDRMKFVAYGHIVIDEDGEIGIQKVSM